MILSRVGALILTAFPLAAIGLALERQDQGALRQLRTYEELRAHVEASLLASYWAWFGIVLLMGFGYVALVEGVAFMLRLPFNARSNSGRGTQQDQE